MKKLRFDLVSPERMLISAEVDQVDVPGSEGDFGVLANHAPLMTALRPGVLTIQAKGKAGERFFVRGGFAEVTPQGLTVLAEEAMPLSELDRAAISLRIRNAEEDVADARDAAAKQRAQETLEQLRELQSVIH